MTAIRKNVMKRAWEIYRELEGGDRIARLSVALKLAWAEAKAVKQTTVVNFKNFEADGKHYWIDQNACYRRNAEYVCGYNYRQQYKKMVEQGMAPALSGKEMTLHPERLSTPQPHTVKVRYKTLEGIVSKEMCINAQCIQQLGEQITQNILSGTTLYGKDTGNHIESLEIFRTYEYLVHDVSVYVYNADEDRIYKRCYEMCEGYSEDSLSEAVKADGYYQYRKTSVKEWTYIQK
ncbi:MAG: hypothetical protein NC177_14165 [Ruminococcus flavefaciens]|nr:hypothetical protein [Ruminococcus flavefaciens]